MMFSQILQNLLKFCRKSFRETQQILFPNHRTGHVRDTCYTSSAVQIEAITADVVSLSFSETWSNTEFRY